MRPHHEIIVISNGRPDHALEGKVFSWIHETHSGVRNPSSQFFRSSLVHLSLHEAGSRRNRQRKAERVARLVLTDLPYSVPSPASANTTGRTMTHSMSVFCVIRSATALSVTAAVNIRPDTRMTRRLGQESSRPSLKPIPLCNMNRRTFGRCVAILCARTEERRMHRARTVQEVTASRIDSGLGVTALGTTDGKTRGTSGPVTCALQVLTCGFSLGQKDKPRNKSGAQREPRFPLLETHGED
jgi:hypothetical protein